MNIFRLFKFNGDAKRNPLKYQEYVDALIAIIQLVDAAEQITAATITLHNEHTNKTTVILDPKYSALRKAIKQVKSF